MNTTKTISSTGHVLAALHAFAASATLTCAIAADAETSAPVVSDVHFTQDAITREVMVTYKIDKPAVVTMDITTNGVSIGGAHLWYQGGDVNRLITDTNGVKTITWAPDKAWHGNVTAPGVEVRAVVTAWATNAPPDYMVVDLSGSGNVMYYATAEAVPGGVTNETYKTRSIVMRKIPAANVTWTMGCGSTASTSPHKVMLTRDFYIGIYELTRGQAGYAASGTSGVTHPLTNIKWNDLRGNGSATSTWPQQEQGSPQNGVIVTRVRSKTSVRFDMPTRSQLEFACRAGSGEDVYATADGPGFALSGNEAKFDQYEWGSASSGGGAHPVGELKPNAWGLYDMLGNAGELVLDWAGASYDPGEVYIDPKGPDSNASELRLRSKSYADGRNPCRASHTDYAWQAQAQSGIRLWAPCEAK